MRGYPGYEGIRGTRVSGVRGYPGYKGIRGTRVSGVRGCPGYEGIRTLLHGRNGKYLPSVAASLPLGCPISYHARDVRRDGIVEGVSDVIVEG